MEAELSEVKQYEPDAKRVCFEDTQAKKERMQEGKVLTGGACRQHLPQINFNDRPTLRSILR